MPLAPCPPTALWPSPILLAFPEPYLTSLPRLSLITSLHQPEAVFRALPRSHTLTVRVDAPEAWNIQGKWLASKPLALTTTTTTRRSSRYTSQRLASILL